MSDSSNTGFAPLVPGFEFLQRLAKTAGAGIPGIAPSIGQWVAPTLDPAELDKRVQELKTVQFWLEQNARMLATTIQALEVQKMTLSTLRSMNVQMNDLREALRIKPQVPGATAATKTSDTAGKGAKKPSTTDAGAASSDSTPPVDPMQWWTALTNQFAQLATNALRDTADDAAKAMAGGLHKPAQHDRSAGGDAPPSASATAAPSAPAAKRSRGTAGR